MVEFLLTTLQFVQSLKFSPLVLIGLMITSLTLILNLKDGNIYLYKFKKHNNIKDFVKKIYLTILLLVLLFFISLLSNYMCIEDINYIWLIVITVIFFILTFWIIKNIISISFIIKEIVLSSLQDD